MAELKGVYGTLKGLILPLDSGDSWTIGRDPDESNLLLEDRKVSRKHVRIKKGAAGFTCENLSSTNPAKLNDALLTEELPLNEGDTLSIGGTVFRFSEKNGSFEEVSDEEKAVQEAVFEEESYEIPEVNLDLSQSSRFIFKVISGPNAGAELALEPGKSYVIGTDTDTVDIVFYDLSISRQHAKITIDRDGMITITDLGSRNGVFINRDKITKDAILTPNGVVTLGTSSFIVIDKEAPLATIATTHELDEEEEILEEVAPTPLAREEEVFVKEKKERKIWPAGALLLSVILLGLVVLLGIGMVSLFKTGEVKLAPENKHQEITSALSQFPGVKYTFKESTGCLFLIGHVSSGIEKSELLYNLKTLNFIRGIDDHIVDDEAIWQEMNLLLAQNPQFEGVSMHSPEPGKFVVAGYLPTAKQAALLNDYLNLNFNYLDLLENQVIVIEQVIEQVKGELFKEGLNGVTVDFTNGVLTLTGYIPTGSSERYNAVVSEFTKIHGVRDVKNYVVALSPEQAVVDLNERFPGRYVVTGYSKHGDVNVNVVLNCRILMRGDAVDGMTIMSIQANTIFLEKDGLKYKIEYNK